MNRLKSDPKWRGDRNEGSGAPRKTTIEQDKRVIKWAIKRRGEEKVTVAKLKQKFLFLRKLSDGLVEDRLHDAQLQWLRRRRKCIVSKSYLAERILYCNTVKRKHETSLLKWADTDGTVYFLDRSEAEHEHSVRAALGSHVWRRSDNSDALWQDCIGPSAYSKGQGIPVKLWGFLAEGVLYVHLLEPGENMDTELYVELIEDKFSEWAGNCEYLVCDYEGCLRGKAAVQALNKIGLELVDPYPRCSQDFNAMENVWKILKDRLAETMLVRNEDRDEFTKRLLTAVQWVNRNRAGQLKYWSTNQKERASDCLKQKPPGGRTKW